jgi:glycosyltransferase involved in cell wall biosynthesis
MTSSSYKTDLVSVLIPCNKTTFLRETLESVLLQSYSNFEIVVVLNGSSTTKLTELKKIYAEKVKFFICEENGIVSALNFGLDKCNGTLIARIDADDLMAVDRIKNQVDFLRKNPSVVCVGGQLDYITSDEFQEPHPGYPLDDSRIRHALYRFSAIPHPGMMFRKEEVQKCGGYSNEFPLIEDWVLLAKLSDLYELANLAEVVVHYRIHSLQSTKSNLTIQQNNIISFARKRFIKSFNDLFSSNNGKLLEFRRTLAGYLYSSAKSQHLKEPKKVKKYFIYFSIMLIDPRLLLNFLSNRYHK